jgi:hypothetical protein
MFAIVGSGFGLYGYLPAVVEALGEVVLLPEAYRAKVEARHELHPYLDAIRWVPDARAALAAANGVVIATPPVRQVEVAMQCLHLEGVRTLVLEKPLAPGPQEAQALIEALRRSGKRYRLGYTFLHAGWAPSLGLGREPVSVTWTFMAHHFAQGLATWKREHAQGGGPLRFFGVHVLALLARHGYREVRSSALRGGTGGEPERWEAELAGPGLGDCRVLVDSRCGERGFRIEAGGAVLVDAREPFESEPASGDADPRVAVLKRLLGTLGESDAAHHALYEAVNGLWLRAEQAMRPNA